MTGPGNHFLLLSGGFTGLDNSILALSFNCPVNKVSFMLVISSIRQKRKSLVGKEMEMLFFSHTTSGFPLFAQGKDKKMNNRTPICGIITMLKCVTLLHLSIFRIFWKSFSCFSNVK